MSFFLILSLLFTLALLGTACLATRALWIVAKPTAANRIRGLLGR